MCCSFSPDFEDSRDLKRLLLRPELELREQPGSKRRGVDVWKAITKFRLARQLPDRIPGLQRVWYCDAEIWTKQMRLKGQWTDTQEDWDWVWGRGAIGYSASGRRFSRVMM